MGEKDCGERYATAVDYDSRSEISVEFFKIVQNKLHFAAHGNTAAEVIFKRANADAPMMGLTSFKGDHPTLRDAQIAKNYLSENDFDINTEQLRGSRKKATMVFRQSSISIIASRRKSICSFWNTYPNWLLIHFVLPIILSMLRCECP